MLLSLVIPAYNEAGRIGGTVDHVCAYLEAQAFSWEVIVVIDGGPPAAAEARTAAAGRDHVRVLVNDVNRGKRIFRAARLQRGHAAIGWRLSTPVIVPTDRGPATHDGGVDAGAEVAIASRTVAGAVEEEDRRPAEA